MPCMTLVPTLHHFVRFIQRRGRGSVGSRQLPNSVKRQSLGCVSPVTVIECLTCYRHRSVPCIQAGMEWEGQVPILGLC